MYNRYIPQPDGSYRRDRIEEAQPRRTTAQHPGPSCDTPPPPPHRPPQEPKPTQQPQPQERKQASQPQCLPPQNEQRAGDFLRQLLPKNIDTGDLIIILLLLLMAGDNAEDRTAALMTLAIYLLI